MPRQIPSDEQTILLNIISRYPDGVSLSGINSELSLDITRRTLQNRLALLVKQGRIIRKGRGRGAKYFAQGNEPKLELSSSNTIPLSQFSTEIKEIVQRPVGQRKIVGYERSFLDSYRPNEVFYLPLATRQHLAKIGRSKEQKRPAGTYAREIFGRLLIDLSWNSSRLEGNTYSLLETERLLKLGEITEGKNADEAQMILNHKGAIEMLVEQSEMIGFNRHTLFSMHALLTHNLLDNMACGSLRTIPVSIGRSTYEPHANPQAIEECFNQILDTAASIVDPFEQSFFIMVHVPYLQPFEDGNKRTSRLAANIPFIRENICPLSFMEVPKKDYVAGLLGVYECNKVDLLRDVFVWAYERSCSRYSVVQRSIGGADPFRIRYRELLAQIISQTVKECTSRRDASTLIKKCANEQIPKEERNRFIEVAETELLSLHEGNIARYRLTPKQYHEWKDVWRGA